MAPQHQWAAPGDVPEQLQTSLDRFYLKQKGILEVIRLIGIGAFSKVYECKIASHEGPVAVKLLNSPSASEARAVEVVRNLQHPHLVQLINVLDMNPLIIAYSLCKGGTLYDLLINMGMNEPSTHDRVRAMHQVFSALAFLHERHVVHRDVRPANVFLTLPAQAIASEDLSLPDVVLGDLGIARTAGDDSPMQTQCGKAWYMAPEMMDPDDGEGYTASVDIFSSGVSLYEVVTGDLPSEADQMGRASMIRATKIASGERPSLDAVRQRPSGDQVADIVESAWAQDAGKRMSAATLVERLGVLV